MIAVRMLSVVLGLLIVGYAVQTAIRTFVLPQPGLSLVSRVVVRMMQPTMRLVDRAPIPAARRHAWLSIYAPLCLLLIVGAAIVLIGLGYTLVLYGLGIPSLSTAFLASISSVSTLGFAALGGGLLVPVVAVAEAMTGILIVALLVGYLPTVYAAFQQREQAIAALEAQTGVADSPVAILEWMHRSSQSHHRPDIWAEWTQWFVALGASHSSLAGILFTRSPEPRRSWVTAAGAVLDAAALARSALAPPAAPQADACIAAGSQALRQIVDGARLRPALGPPGREPSIHVTQPEFAAACVALAAAGLSLAPDREAAWGGFAERRGQYDAALLALCRLTRTPVVGWSFGRPAAPPLARPP